MSPATPSRPPHIRRTTGLATAALVTALISASAWIVIPLGAVPVTLQVFVVVLAALLLTPAWAAASMAAYLLLGAIGLPVFSGGQGGIGVLAGPTGGYLVGFLLAAELGALARARLTRSTPAPAADLIAAGVAVTLIYIVGVVQLAIVTGVGPVQAITAGAVPFVIPDAIKAVVAVGVASAVRRARGSSV